MRSYGSVISLSENSRGIYSLDPSIGCTAGLNENSKGCFNDCYALRISRIYGYDFNTVYRDFKNQKQLLEIQKAVTKIKMPFIRMGTMGDPSENWEHTINIIRKLRSKNQFEIFDTMPKEIVIITRHWTSLTEEQVIELSALNVCINTTVSAVDSTRLFDNCMVQYERIKPYLKSILRMVTFDFNLDSEDGKGYNNLQTEVLKKHSVLETVFRASKSNELVKQNIIKVHKTKFLGKNTLVSKRDKKTYFGKCSSCLEMCGINM